MKIYNATFTLNALRYDANLINTSKTTSFLHTKIFFSAILMLNYAETFSAHVCMRDFSV
jgi:hypothetical protein